MINLSLKDVSDYQHLKNILEAYRLRLTEQNDVFFQPLVERVDYFIDEVQSVITANEDVQELANHRYNISGREL